MRFGLLTLEECEQLDCEVLSVEFGATKVDLILRPSSLTRCWLLQRLSFIHCLLIILLRLRGNYLVVDLWAQIRRAHRSRLIELLSTALAWLFGLEAILNLGNLVFLLGLRL